MATYVVTSDRLSRKRGETFTDEEIGGNVETLIAGGHLVAVEPSSTEVVDSGEEADGVVLESAESHVAAGAE
jgi:hypothetical protein